MFRQRRKPTFQERIRGYVWPRTGWKRTFRYILVRLSRIPASGQSIAAGFACGAAMSFTPFVGVHFILSAALAWLLRVNMTGGRGWRRNSPQPRALHQFG